MPQDKQSSKVTNKIEALCEQGCSEINNLLKQAKEGKNPDSLSSFEDNEIAEIIDELSKIMSVYDKKQS